MPEYHYELLITVPDDEIDPDVQAEIDDGASDHDDTPEKRIGRYLGGFVNDAESTLRDTLPIGWRAYIETVDE